MNFYLFFFIKFSLWFSFAFTLPTFRNLPLSQHWKWRNVPLPPIRRCFTQRQLESAKWCLGQLGFRHTQDSGCFYELTCAIFSAFSGARLMRSHGAAKICLASAAAATFSTISGSAFLSFSPHADCLFIIGYRENGKRVCQNWWTWANTSADGEREREKRRGRAFGGRWLSKSSLIIKRWSMRGRALRFATNCP